MPTKNDYQLSNQVAPAFKYSFYLESFQRQKPAVFILTVNRMSNSKRIWTSIAMIKPTNKSTKITVNKSEVI